MFDSLIQNLHGHAPALALLAMHGSAGKSFAELALRGCVVAALKRGVRLVAHNGSTRLEAGDVLTLIGGEKAVYAA